jgi:hypothetical protein
VSGTRLPQLREKAKLQGEWVRLALCNSVPADSLFGMRRRIQARRPGESPLAGPAADCGPIQSAACKSLRTAAIVSAAAGFGSS